MFETVRRMWRRLHTLARRGDHDRAMAEEMRFHLEMEAADLRQAGVPGDEAARRARLTFGGVERFKEEGRDVRGTRLIEDLWQDLSYATRQLRASPGFAAATVLTLALGIGATTMMYSNHRYITAEGNTLASPERLVFLGQGPKNCPRCANMPAGNYAAIRDQVQSLEYAAMIEEWEPIFRGADRAELLDGQRVTGEFFQTLGIQPMLGRTLLPGDMAAERQQVLVLTEKMWRTRFNADVRVLGQEMILDRVPYTIVGVVANKAVYPQDTEFWAPLVLTPEQANDRTSADYRVVGRLRDNATLTMLSAELGGIAGQIAAEFPTEMNRSTFTAGPLLDLHRFGGSIPTFSTAVGLVLLIACINLAGLLVARLSVRRRELALRRALGAKSGRLVRQLLAETVMLTSLAGALGAALAVWGSRALLGWTELYFDGHAFAVALAIGLLSGLVIGLWPAFRFVRPALVHELHDSTRTSTSGVDSARGRHVLVTAQVAATIVLVSAAGLLARSFKQQYEIKPGFSSDRILALRVRGTQPAPNATPDPERGARLVAAIAAVPGVERAGATLGLPFGHGEGAGRFEIDGAPPLPPDERPSVRMHAATSGYFEALGIPILRGRSFSDADRATAPRVAIINQVVAQRYFDGEDPIGRSVIIDSVRWQVVGVVAAIFHGDVENLTTPDIYRPLQQWPRPTVWIAVRARGNAEQIAPAVAAAVRRFDPDIAITRLLTMNAVRANDMGSERRLLRVMSAFAIAAILISAIGLYGLISYSVSQRTREFGMRLALGATRVAVLRLVLGQGLRLAAFGAAIGIAGAIASLRVMQSMLFGVSQTDPLTLGAAALAICAVALFAGYVPAHRAMMVDPMTTLRND